MAAVRSPSSVSDAVPVKLTLTPSSKFDPLVGAVMDVWQPNSEGYYYVQRDYLPEWNFYARFHTDENGEVEFQTVAPGDYPVPTSGPTGSMLEQLGRLADRHRAGHRQP